MTVLSGSGVEPGTDGGGAPVVCAGAVFDGRGATLVWPGTVVERGGGVPLVWAGAGAEEDGVLPNGTRVEPAAGAAVFDEAGGGELVKDL